MTRPDTGSRPPRRRRGRLTSEDRAIWEQVARQVRPILPARPTGEAEPEATRPPAIRPQEDDAGLGRRSPTTEERSSPARDDADRPGLGPAGPRRPAAGSVTYDLHDPSPARIGRPEAGLDRRTADRLRRGDRAPDARIDLHGMTAERAHRLLDRFILDAVSRGLRCVLVITGKGSRQARDEADLFTPMDRGVLRRDAPRWLRAGPAARDIVGIYEAHRRHGGEGAFYVYLKKRR